MLVVVLALASAYGLARRATDGRFGGRRGPAAPAAASSAAAAGPVPSGSPALGPLAGTELAGRLGRRATLLQFSSAFCAPCRATRGVLGQVADLVPGVTHVEVDAEAHLDLVRRAHVLRTPTTLVLDAAGVEVERAGGVPRREAVLAVLARVSG